MIPTIGTNSARTDLVEAQVLALRTIHRALTVTGPEIDVEVCTVRFPDEPCELSWATDLPTLDRSILDVGSFRFPRRLPLLRDVLAGFGDPADFDLAVLTNADISVHPLFYELVADIHRDGYDAFSITRRTVQPPFRTASMARLATGPSSPHAGHDCIIMDAPLVSGLDVGEVSLGVRWVMRGVLWGLQLAAERFRVFAELHATWHLGDDRFWTDDRFADYSLHNERETLAVLDRLQRRWGYDRVATIGSTAPFRRAQRTGEPVRGDLRFRNPPLPQSPPLFNDTHRVGFLVCDVHAERESIRRALTTHPAVRLRSACEGSSSTTGTSTQAENGEATLRKTLRNLSTECWLLDDVTDVSDASIESILDGFPHQRMTFLVARGGSRERDASISARIEHLRTRAPAANWVSIDAGDLDREAAIRDLLRRTGLRPDRATIQGSSS